MFQSMESIREELQKPGFNNNIEEQRKLESDTLIHL